MKTPKRGLGKSGEKSSIAQLFASTGDLQFIRAKMSLAESAGQLASAIVQAHDNEEIEKSRKEFSEKIRDFAEKYGAKTSLGVDLKKSAEIDRFAIALIDFGMTHRVR